MRSSRPPRWIPALTLAAVVCALPSLPVAWAADPPPPAMPGPFENIHVIDFDGDIEALMLAYVKRRVEAAQADGADCIVLRIDSPGGTILHAKKLGDLIFELPGTIHTVAWVPKMAMSGAAFVSLACDEIILTSRASIGDSQPIIAGAQGKPEPVGEKLESPLRSWFATYAQGNGYPVLLAQAMVSQRMEVLRVQSRLDDRYYFVEGSDFRDAEDEAEPVPGVLKRDLKQVGSVIARKGELLTLTGAEAQEYGFVKRRFDGGLATDEAQVLAALKAPGAKVSFTHMSFSEKAAKWLLAISGMLSAVVVVSVLLFMFQGPGLMTIVGAICLILVLLINVTAEQMNGFPLFLILVGVALLAAEVFLIPGFGVAGVLGIGAMATGFLFLASGSTIGDTGGIDGDMLRNFGFQFVLTGVAAFLALFALSRFFPMLGPGRKMILHPSGSGVRAPSAVSDSFQPGAQAPDLGAAGIAHSTLRPAGSASFEGRLVDVVSDGAFIDAGARVVVIQVEGDRVTVRAQPAAPADAPPESPDA